MKSNETVKLFEHLCLTGELEMAKSLTLSQKFEINFDCLLPDICYEGKLNIIKWLYSEYKDVVIVNIKRMFKSAIHSGNMELIKWIYDIKKIKIKYGSEHDSNIFIQAINGGCLDAVKFLYDIKIPKSDVLNISFVLACQKGYIDIAQYLYTKEIDIHHEHDSAFYGACYYNHWNVAIWLSTLTQKEGDFTTTHFVDYVD